MTGGGFGGSAIVLAEATDVDTLTKAVQEAFAAAAFTAPRVFEAVPRGGRPPPGLRRRQPRRLVSVYSVIPGG